jgi:hypothetical protein
MVPEIQLLERIVAQRLERIVLLEHIVMHKNLRLCIKQQWIRIAIMEK